MDPFFKGHGDSTYAQLGSRSHLFESSLHAKAGALGASVEVEFHIFALYTVGWSSRQLLVLIVYLLNSCTTTYLPQHIYNNLLAFSFAFRGPRFVPRKARIALACRCNIDIWGGHLQSNTLLAPSDFTNVRLPCPGSAFNCPPAFGLLVGFRGKCWKSTNTPGMQYVHSYHLNWGHLPGSELRLSRNVAQSSSKLGGESKEPSIYTY